MVESNTRLLIRPIFAWELHCRGSVGLASTVLLFDISTQKINYWFYYLLWVLVAGSALTIDSRSVNAFVVTNLAASIGAICWMLMDMILKRNLKLSLVGFCNGAFAGLVAITPAAGYVSPWSSLIIGVLGKSKKKLVSNNGYALSTNLS